MNRPTFFRGVLLAMGLSAGAGVAFMILTTLLPGGFLLRSIFSILGMVYIGFLLRQSDERTGRWVTLTIWTLVTGIAWYVSMPLALFAGVQVALIWLIRSLYYYSSVISALIDMALTGLGLAAAVWATSETHSLFLAVWAFFLTQALFVLIPRTSKTNSASRTATDYGTRFGSARQAADAALRKLSIS